MTKQSFFSTKNQKEMKIPAVQPSEAKEYFLNFSTREEYLALRAEWRALYAYLSQAIRSNKNSSRKHTSWDAKLRYRIEKSGRPFTAAEHSKRYAMATRNVPPHMDTLGHDATHLLEVRQKMKLLAAAQRMASRRELALA